MHGINACFYQFKDEPFLIFRAFFHENIDIRLVCSGIVHLHSGKQFIYGNAEGIDDTDDGLQTGFPFCILNVAYVGNGEFRFFRKLCL